jgi:sulfatase modifying factor 1
MIYFINIIHGANVRMAPIVFAAVCASMLACQEQDTSSEGPSVLAGKAEKRESLVEGSTYIVGSSWAQIDGGEYVPLYGAKGKTVFVDSFMMDAYPVTNADFLSFVHRFPQWRKSKVAPLFADKTYLAPWKDDLTLGNGQLPNAPVTNVSWFAANAYCACRNARLPTTDQWEYAAMADSLSKDAREKPAYNQFLLGWYEKQNTNNHPVGSAQLNAWGLYDMHGLVWEWTDDFSAVMIGDENRGGPASDKNLFCGSAALGATDLMNYAAFMRYAFRASMRAKFSARNLGFRCAKKQ